nr:serine/threonine-protein kinase [Pseudomarimonas arenosa]
MSAPLLRELFDQLSAIADPSAREAALCAATENIELRASLRRLLQAEASLDPLDSVDSAEPIYAFVEAQQRRAWIGRRLGEFELVELLGSGGMGAVYRARRCAEFEQQVAIKLLNQLRPVAPSLQRFQAERQALALLDHPGIARLFDAAISADGYPYLVMELIQGAPLDHYCRRQRVSLRDRVKLMVEVCAAVQAAHARLVLHRDLKPANILVSHDGHPKVVDFGIAKLLDQDGVDATRTVEGQRALSLDYASPEQIRGEVCGVQTDVYSLGVVLFELLTGRRPFFRSGMPLPALLAALEREPPPLASGSIEASFAPDLSRSQLRGDLDAILQCALASEQRHRYRSVAEFAADLQRYLDGRAVHARGAVRGYRAWRFVRRNGWALSMASLIVFGSLLLALFYRSSSLSLEAERNKAQLAQIHAELERSRAEQLNELILDSFRVADPRQGEGAELSARKVLDRAAERLGVLSESTVGNAELLLTLSAAYVGLGLYDQAETVLSRAAQLSASRPSEQAKVELQRADLARRRTQFAEAGEHLAQARGLMLGQGEQLAGLRLDADEQEALLALATDRGAEGVQLLQRNRAQRIALQGVAHRDSRRVGRQLAFAHRSLGEFEQAEAALLQLLGEVGGETAQAAERQRLLAELAALRLRQRRTDDAMQAAQQSLQAARDLYGSRHVATANALDLLATLEKRAGQLPQAEAHYREAIAVKRAALGPGQLAEAISAYNLGLLLLYSRNDAAGAEQALASAVGIAAQHWHASHSNLHLLRTKWAASLVALGRIDEAEALLQQAKQVFAAAPEQNEVNLAWVRAELAEIRQQQAEPEASRQLIEQAWPVLSAHLAADDPELSLIRSRYQRHAEPAP